MSYHIELGSNMSNGFNLYSTQTTNYHDRLCAYQMNLCITICTHIVYNMLEICIT